MTMDTDAPAGDAQEQASKRVEVICGALIAVLAAILAISDLGAGKYGDDELLAHAEKSNAYLWYQSKGIKETLVEGQRDTLQTLLAAGSISDEQVPSIQALIAKLDTRIKRYGQEKNEILQGSEKVGKEQWVQAVDGELGRVIGAKQWETKAEALGEAGDSFDYAALFLQLSLVLGAISLIVQNARPRQVFFFAMITLGAVGTVFAVIAFRQALTI